MASLALPLFLLHLVVTLEALHPVILIPGLGGNQLEAKLHRAHVEHFYCYKHSDWYNIWLSIKEEGLATKCTIDNLRLIINETDGSTNNQEGVWIRVGGFGITDTMEWLDPWHYFFQKKLSYMKYLVDRLTSKGYRRGISVLGAPYDFRKAPNEMEQYMTKLTTLIEVAYLTNNHSKVVLVGHSMGANVALYFFQGKSQEWKDKHVEAFISLGAPYAGSVKAIQAIVSGDNFGFPKLLVGPLALRPLVRSMPSVTWLIPYSFKWGSDEVLVKNVHRSYTVNDYDDLFNDIGFKKGILFRRNTEQLIKISEGPGVKTFCMYGTGERNTPEKYTYRRDRQWNDNLPSVEFGPGDGTVNKRSLEVCKEWENTKVTEFEGVAHMDIVKNSYTVDHIVDVLLKLT